jgi:hypothetical protein
MRSGIAGILASRRGGGFRAAASYSSGMHVLDESDLLLDLLREAGDEPVTLDELHVVGVHDPAQALLALELAGHSVHRVYEMTDAAMCVRLGAPKPEPVAPAERTRPAATPPAGVDTRFLLGALLAALVLLVVARRD